MKISRKIKKFFVSILTATLSIIMFVTSISASNVYSSTKAFEHEGVVSVSQNVTWDSRPNRHTLTFSVDLECYENDEVECVLVEMDLYAYYPTKNNAITQYSNEEIRGEFTHLNTWDSDEISINVPDYGLGHDNIEIISTITYTIQYYNGLKITYRYRYNVNIVYSEVSHEQTLIYYFYDDSAVVE